ncbi:Trehalose-6-P synthase/phosphatase complex subunit [Binucleata daphniae]
MHCILPNFANFKSKNFDAYGMQRMNNIFNYQQWNDMYKRYKDDYNYKDYLTLNKIFAEEICNLYEDGDCIVILEHDLWMTAGMIREKISDAKIGILCLQPIPNLESFKTFFNPKCSY